MRHSIDANNFELKTALIHMVEQYQFGGAPTDDPNLHLEVFLKIYNALKYNGATGGCAYSPSC